MRQNLSSLNANLSAVSRDGFAAVSISLAHSLDLSLEHCNDVHTVKYPPVQSVILLTGWSVCQYSVIPGTVLSSLPGKHADGIFQTIFDTGRQWMGI